MKIYIGADHRGFVLKAHLERVLKKLHHTVTDCGAAKLDPTDDYPVFAAKVATNVTKSKSAKGILICGSGNGVAIAANRVPGIRAAVCMHIAQAVAARRDEDANVLCLAADFILPEAVWGIMRAFLETPFSGEARHKKRIAQLG